MKKQINEIRRMQQLAGLITESEYQESLMNENDNSKAETLKTLFNDYVERDTLNSVLKKLNFQSTEEFEKVWEDAGLEVDVFSTDNKGNAIYTIWSDSYEAPGDAIEFINNKFDKIIPDELYDGDN
jgi:hypothetical protein